MMRDLLTLIFVCILPVSLIGQSTPEIVSVSSSPAEPAIYELFELHVQLNTATSNPHDYDQALLSAIFYSPSGFTIEVEGFYYQHFVVSGQGLLEAYGDPYWRLRFTPDEEGKWSYQLFFSDQYGTDSTRLSTFRVKPGTSNGFVRLQADHPHLIDDAGQSVFLIGENLGWANQTDGSDKMGYFFSRLYEHEMNFAKLILTPWAYQIEWTEGGLRNYFPRQKQAFLLDSMFRMADAMNIYMMLTFSIHGEFKDGYTGEDWASNPYNIIQGGMCEEPQDFFIRDDAKAAFKNRIRYLLARYSYSTRLVSWGLLSEADNFSWYKQQSQIVADWCNEMSDYVIFKDPNHHLISTGFALNSSNPDVWHHPNTHFTQLHQYSRSPDIEGDVLRQTQLFVNQFEKPMLIGEFGLGHHPDSLIRWDASGLSLHNSLWTSLMAGSMGTVVPWFWEEYIDTMQLYPLFTPISRFVSGEDLSEHTQLGMHMHASSEEKEDGMLIPTFDDLTRKAPSRLFTFHSTGQLVPTADSMSRFLFGPASIFSALRNPPEITAYWEYPSLVSIETGSQVSNGLLQISIDGIVVLEQQAASETVYQLEIQAGQHTIRIDNVGNGFFSMLEINQICFHDFLPAIRAFGRTDGQSAWAWIHNRHHNWRYRYDNGQLPSPANGSITIPLGPGIFTTQWFNTTTAEIDSTTQHLADENGFELNIQGLETDIAVKVSRITQIEEVVTTWPEMVVYPNPFSDGVYFAFELSKPQTACLQLFDTKGSIVFETHIQLKRKGVHKISWDGQSLTGLKVPPGLYTYRLLVGKQKIYRGKIVRY